MNNELRINDVVVTDDAIKSAQMQIDTSLTGRTLDVDTMTVTVDTDAASEPLDPTMLLQTNPVLFLRNASPHSAWFLKSASRVGPSLFEMTCMSSLGRLAQMAHRGGIYDDTSGTTAGELIDSICGIIPHEVSATFANVRIYGWLPYVEPSGESGAKVGSAKDNLLQVLFALNATVRDDAEGTLHIENLSTDVSSQLTADRILRDGARVVHETPITAVTVLEHSFIKGNDVVTLFEGTTDGAQTIIFPEPMWGLDPGTLTLVESGANYAVVTGSGTLTGKKYVKTLREISRPVTTSMNAVVGKTVTITTTSINWYLQRIPGSSYCYVTDLNDCGYGRWFFPVETETMVRVYSASVTIINGVPVSAEARLVFNSSGPPGEPVALTNSPSGTRSYSVSIPAPTRQESVRLIDNVPITIPNAVRIEDATLVGLTASGDVADRLQEYYRHRTRIECNAYLDYEDAGDVVSIYDPYDKVMRQACLERIYNLRASRVLCGSLSAVVDLVPWQVRPFSDEQLIIDANSASMTVVLPEGVDKVTIVIIGGGAGGAGGMAGETGESGASTSASGGSSSEGAPGEGGAGGDPGAGGAGGSIYRQEILNIPENRTFVCTIGAGGTGGAAEGGAGSAGTATTVSFGDSTLSSADGSGSSAGYMDPISGTYFARSGNPGAPGGAGGDGISGRSESGGADRETVAPSGEAVDPHVGGAGTTGFWFTGGYGPVSYTEGDWRQTEAPTQIPDDTQYSGWYNYRFNSTTGTYSATSNRSGTVYQGMGSFYVYSASGHTLTRTLYYWPSWRDYPSRSRAEQTATPTYGEMWGKVYGGSGGGGASGAADGSAAVAGTSTEPGTGGAGGAGGSRAAATVYGQGGAGGHGGGGGGGGGGSAIWTHSNAGSYSCQGGYGGAPGAGGAGGAGAPGCVIFYYRVPTDEE